MQSPALAPSPPRSFLARRLEPLCVVVVCALFVGMAWPFTAGMGIEADEALSGAGIYPPLHPLFELNIGGHSIPLMVLSYLGALKVWLCAPLFALWGPDEITLRLPTLLIGGLNIALFWYFLRAAHSRRAAWIGTVLLATDTSFVLLTSTDFGPVIIQWFLKISLMWLFIAWKRTGRMAPFAAAAFLGGVALWDKATFMWIGAGMGLAAVVAFPRDVLRALKPRTAALGVGAFLAGASPFILFNFERPLETFRTSAHVAPAELTTKMVFLRGTLNGNLLRGFYILADTPPKPGRPQDLFERAVVVLNHKFKMPDRNWTIYAIAAALLGLPFVWRTRARAAALFAIISFVAGWIAMGISAGGGVSAHHVALVWPMHFVLIAVVFAQLSYVHRVGPAIAAIAVAALATVNVGVTTLYYNDLIRSGPGTRWTTATYDLVDYLSATRAARIYVVDWGILETLALLSEGTLPVQPSSDLTAPNAPADRGSPLVQTIVQPGTVFVSHPRRYEQVAGVNAAMDAFAARAGLQKALLNIIHDDFGREAFTVYRFQ